MQESINEMENYVVPASDATPVNLGNLAEFGVKENEPSALLEKDFQESVTGPLKRVSLNSELVDSAQFEERKKASDESTKNEGLFLERLFKRKELKNAA